MDNEIFRQKSLKKIKSPDNLNEYIKVINPGLWIVFLAAFILLAGAFVWGYFGQIEDKISVSIVVQSGEATCDYNQSVEDGMKVLVGGYEGQVTSVTPLRTTISFNNQLPDGVYSGCIVLGLISPISFVFN